MRKVQAFLAALALFLLTVGGCHWYVMEGVRANNAAVGVLTTEKKGMLRTLLKEYMPVDGIPVFGSSEFQHGLDTPYHPQAVFAGSDFHPMLIGAGYYQSLSHAITLASIEDSLQTRKAVLIVSPQWFRKTGVVDQAYASRFSETHYAAAMANARLGEETRQYLLERTQKLLCVDEKTQKRVQMYGKMAHSEMDGQKLVGYEAAWSAFLEEKERFESALLLKSSAYRRVAESVASSGGGAEPDWDGLLARAQQEGERENQNPFFMDDSYYKRLEAYLAQKKDMNKDAVNGYQTGPEFEDLRCFLRVCRELEITPMLVIVPVNGYYYDFTGFPVSARQGYYEKVRAIAEEFGVAVADFSDQEYTKYFFEDRVHIGKKGWVMVNESIYQL